MAMLQERAGLLTGLGVVRQIVVSAEPTNVTLVGSSTSMCLDGGHPGGDPASPDRLSCSSTNGRWTNPTDLVQLVYGSSSIFKHDQQITA